jgi:tRNA (cmo5U34)-methyltransferase
MFLPLEKRGSFLKGLTSKIKKGGALIIFDKTETEGGYISTVLHRLTMAGKVATGVPAEDILAKELSLGGVQRPIPKRFVEFACSNVTEIFRFGEFAGWVIERTE